MVGEKHNARQRLLDVVPLKQPFVVMIDPCGACNFKCSFCPCNISDVNAEQRHSVMKIELFEKIVNDLRQFPGKIKAIDMYGLGEPLLNKKLPEMIKMIKKADVCEKVRISTNASLLDNEMGQALCEAGLDYMKVSLEALDDAGYKEVCGVNVKYNDIVDKIKRFYENNSRGRTEVGVKIISSAIKKEEDRQRFIETFTPISDYVFIETVKPIWAGFEKMALPEWGGRRKITVPNTPKDIRYAVIR